MKRVRITESLCPECYTIVPAAISEKRGSVWMEKLCPRHGWSRAMVERDPFWFELCRGFDCRNIYDSYLIDITDRCNIRCKYCYHENKGGDYDVEAILTDAEENKSLAPFALIGGEPTMHERLPELYQRMARIGPTTIVTNGIRLVDEELYLSKLLGAGILDGNVINVALSFHKESNGKDFEFVELCRSMELKIPSCFWVIDELSQIDEALAVFDRYRGTIQNMRIKAASNLGVETKASNKIFTSDMLHYLKARGRMDLLLNSDPKMYASNKVSIASVMWEGLFLLLVSWYDVHNVDLADINCGPWYRAKDGNIYNLATALIMNEAHYKRLHADTACE